MRKIHIILPLLALSVIWAQKEVPGLGSTSETIGDEKFSGKKIQPIDADIVQQIRMLKANKQKAFMKKQILSGEKVDKKTFIVPQQESKFLVIKEVIELIKSENSSKKISMIKKQQNSNMSDLSSSFEAYISKENKSNRLKK